MVDVHVYFEHSDFEYSYIMYLDAYALVLRRILIYPLSDWIPLCTLIWVRFIMGLNPGCEPSKSSLLIPAAVALFSVILVETWTGNEHIYRRISRGGA